MVNTSDIPSGYEPVTLPYSMGDRALFPDGKLKLFKHASDQRSLAHVYFSKEMHGPPQFVHGGAQAYILDEVMGCTAWMHEIPVVAKNFEVELQRPVPIETWLEAKGEITGREEKLVFISSSITDSSGKTYSSSKGIFRLLDAEKVAQFTG